MTSVAIWRAKVIIILNLSKLFSHMSTNNLLEPYQSAYKPNHGTETALLKVKNDILCAPDNKKAVHLALSDLCAAFDTIDFDILNERLSNCLGINGSVRAWILSYLQGSESKVGIACGFSEAQTMGFGLPQESVVGPGMFSNYTYPLGKIIQKHNLKYHIYTDYYYYMLHLILAYLETASLHFSNWNHELLKWTEKTGWTWINSN